MRKIFVVLLLMVSSSVFAEKLQVVVSQYPTDFFNDVNGPADLNETTKTIKRITKKVRKHKGMNLVDSKVIGHLTPVQIQKDYIVINIERAYWHLNGDISVSGGMVYGGVVYLPEIKYHGKALVVVTVTRPNGQRATFYKGDWKNSYSGGANNAFKEIVKWLEK